MVWLRHNLIDNSLGEVRCKSDADPQP